jgi:hypothetical protein
VSTHAAADTAGRDTETLLRYADLSRHPLVRRRDRRASRIVGERPITVLILLSVNDIRRYGAARGVRTASARESRRTWPHCKQWLGPRDRHPF